jgi:hypothetical protein
LLQCKLADTAMTALGLFRPNSAYQGHVGSLATRVVCTPPWRGSSRRQLQHGDALPRDQSCDYDQPPIGELQRVVMNALIVHVDLEELGDLVHDLRFAEQTRRAVAKPP